MPKRKKQSIADKLSIAGIVIVSAMLVLFWFISAVAGGSKIFQYLLGLTHDYEAMPIVFLAIFCTLFWGFFVAWCFSED